MTRLTHRETSLLAYLAGHIEARGFCPSYRDMAGVVGLSSTSRVAAAISRLEDTGKLRRLPNRARTIMPTVPVAVPRAPDGAPLFFVRIPQTGEAQ